MTINNYTTQIKIQNTTIEKDAKEQVNGIKKILWGAVLGGVGLGPVGAALAVYGAIETSNASALRRISLRAQNEYHRRIIEQYGTTQNLEELKNIQNKYDKARKNLYTKTLIYALGASCAAVMSVAIAPIGVVVFVAASGIAVAPHLQDANEKDLKEVREELFSLSKNIVSRRQNSDKDLTSTAINTNRPPKKSV